MQIGIEVEIFLDAQILIEAEPLRHVGDAVLDPLRLGGHVDAQHRELAPIDVHQAGDEADQRGLAGAVGPDQRRERAVIDRDGNIVERGHDFAGLAPE